MSDKRACCVFAIALAALTTPAWADTPWSRLVLFKHLEADPQEIYPISEQNGPWTIMAASFCGEGAEEQAQQLIYELRKEFKLPAYSYQKKFEFSKPVEGNGLDRYGDRVKMRYRQARDVVEVAVLVGDFPTVDDPEAQRVLKKLKYAQPKSLSAAGQKSHQALADVRAIQRQVKQATLPKDSDELKRGPMGGAFVITNPLLPTEYFVPKGIDKLVLDMNRGVTHSLLDCPGRYTVKVATFSGHAILLDRRAMQALEGGATPKSWLEDAANNAHVLTEALRQKGYEAFEFHDRSASIVTVGSFDSVGPKRADQKIEINPTIHKLMRIFGAETKIEPGKAPQVGKPKSLAGIPFDIQPVPVEVPRRNISADYGHSVMR